MLFFETIFGFWYYMRLIAHWQIAITSHYLLIIDIIIAYYSLSHLSLDILRNLQVSRLVYNIMIQFALLMINE